MLVIPKISTKYPQKNIDNPQSIYVNTTTQVEMTQWEKTSDKIKTGCQH